MDVPEDLGSGVARELDSAHIDFLMSSLYYTLYDLYPLYYRGFKDHPIPLVTIDSLTQRLRIVGYPSDFWEYGNRLVSDGAVQGEFMDSLRKFMYEWRRITSMGQPMSIEHGVYLDGIFLRLVRAHNALVYLV